MQGSFITIKYYNKYHISPSFDIVNQLEHEFVFNKWTQAIMAEGKQQALCVGVMKMSADSMWDNFFSTFYTSDNKILCRCSRDAWFSICLFKTEKKSTRESELRTFIIWMMDCGTWRLINDDIICNARPPSLWQVWSSWEQRVSYPSTGHT